jgi:hypothetical protein
MILPTTPVTFTANGGNIDILWETRCDCGGDETVQLTVDKQSIVEVRCPTTWVHDMVTSVALAQMSEQHLIDDGFPAMTPEDRALAVEEYMSVFTSINGPASKVYLRAKNVTEGVGG